MTNHPPLDIWEDRKDAVSVFTIRGSIDSDTLADFEKTIGKRLQESGARVILDCSELTYINSRCLGLLAQGHRLLSSTGGALVLCRMNPKIGKTLEILGLGRSLRIFGTLEQAIDAAS